MVATAPPDKDELQNVNASEKHFANLAGYNPVDEEPNFAGKHIPSADKGIAEQLKREEADSKVGADSKPAVLGGENQSDQTSPAPESQNAPSRLSKFRQGITKSGNRIFGSKAGLKKWLIAGGVPAVGILIIIGVILFMIASLLKIPNMASYITEYEMASLTREVGAAADRAVQEKLAVDTADPTLYEQIVSSVKGIRDGWDQKFLKQFSPNSAIRVLRSNNGLELNYKTPTIAEGLLGKQTLQSIKLNGKTFEVVPQRGFLRSFIPKMVDLPYLADQAAFASNFAPSLRGALQENGINPVIRGLVARQLRQELGINLIAWHVGKFVGKNTDEAILEMNKEAYDEIGKSGENAVQQSKTPDIQNAEEQINAETQNAVADPQKLAETIKNNGIPKEALSTLNGAFDDSILKEVVSFVNPAYAIALPACIVYEGSLETAGPSINATSTAQQAAYYFLASGADQLKAGLLPSKDKIDPKAQLAAISALSSKIGDPTHSIPYLRATGHSVDTLTTNVSPEAGALQTFTLIDATPGIGGSVVGNALKTIANGACPYFADLKFGLATGILLQIATVVLDIPSGGTASAGEVAVEAGADAAAETTAKSFATRFVEAFLGSKITGGAIGGKLRQIVVKGAIDMAGLTALTVIAKLVVMFRAGQLANGLEQQTDFINMADSGANIHKNELSRRRGGRSLTCAELEKTTQADKGFLADVNSSKSFSDRYLAITNPDSLLSQTAMMTYGQFNGSLLKPLASALNIFSGPLGFGTILNSVTGIGYAATPCSHQYYGNVQFGWSMDEESLIDSDNSYLPLENQQVLDQSGQEEEIFKKYAACFGYSYDDSGTSLNPTDSNSKLHQDVKGDGSIGALLSSGNILRNSDGDLVTDQDYLCSPQNLSYHNPLYGDLVFRVRLALSYEPTVQEMTNLQTISDN